MKKLAIILLSILFLNVSAQEKLKETKTISFKVSGNCEQCKNRIENAVDIKGVKFAEWDVKTQLLKVIYRSDKVSEEKIKQTLLNAGHDVENQKANEESYKKLPACCQYREGKHGM